MRMFRLLSIGVPFSGGAALYLEWIFIQFDGDKGSFPLEGMFLHIISLRFSNGLVKGVYLG